jgi:ABC-type branched-subunit amino acid transport system ATPase component
MSTSNFSFCSVLLICCLFLFHQIFAAFKGVSPPLVRSEAQRMINEVGLQEKANAKTTTLSGGQKRKLSLGMALIGDSKVVILDEPTSGMVRKQLSLSTSFTVF